MSILIKGMGMPKSCDECRIMVFEDTNCLPELFCGCPIVFKAYPQGVGHRPDYCPLIEVSLHGRLIDADAMKTKINGSDYHTIEIVKQWVDEQPTVIESESK